MSDRLHEIIAEIAILHKQLLENKKIDNANEVLEFIKDYSVDTQKHYLNLLLQHYFQQNDVTNLKVLLLIGAKFDMRFTDVKEAFFNIKSSDENVIEFMEDSVVFIKEKIDENDLKDMYNYYKSNLKSNELLDKTIDLIKRNRYVCICCFHNQNSEFGNFFLNEDLLLSLKRDLSYLLK